MPAPGSTVLQGAWVTAVGTWVQDQDSLLARRNRVALAARKGLGLGAHPTHHAAALSPAPCCSPEGKGDGREERNRFGGREGAVHLHSKARRWGRSLSLTFETTCHLHDQAVSSEVHQFLGEVMDVPSVSECTDAFLLSHPFRRSAHPPGHHLGVLSSGIKLQ